MDPPNKTPQKPPDDLAEVERAISVLRGRHPEHERTRREDEEKRAARKAEIDAKARVENRRAGLRKVLIGTLVLSVVGFAVVAALSFRTEIARRGRLEQAGDPYRAMGFVQVESSGRASVATIETNVAAGCIIATSTKPGAKIALTHQSHGGHGAVNGPMPVITCLCEASDVKVTSDAGPGEGLVLLRADTSTVGGSRAFAFLPFEPGTTGAGDEKCADASLDAWVDGRKWPQSGSPRVVEPVDDAAVARWFESSPKYARLRGAGFKLAALVKPEAPFGFVEVPASSCVVLASSAADDRPSLRARGGALIIDSPAQDAGYCAQGATTALAQHAGKGELAVLVAPAAGTGGLYGLRELSGGSLGAVAVPVSDHGWNAKELLVSSAVPESLIAVANAPHFGDDPAARIVALSAGAPSSFVSESPAEVFSFCDPPLDKSTASVCVFSGSQRWRVDNAEAVGGIARAKLPFWLFALQGVTEPAGLKVMTDLLTLARSLRRQGFEPTTIDAITELDKGTEVLGRAKEDAMVAFVLSEKEPWFIPLTDGPAWSIGGAPRIVPIKPLERVVVGAPPKVTLPPKATRHTVVFRRRQR